MGKSIHFDLTNDNNKVLFKYNNNKSVCTISEFNRTVSLPSEIERVEIDK